PADRAAAPPASKATEPAAQAAHPADVPAGPPAPAAERSDAARPPAPRSAAPEPRPASSAAADAADDQDRDEDPEQRRQGNGRRVALARRRSRHRHAVQRDTAPFGDALDDSRRPRKESGAERPRRELRRHHCPARLTRKAVGDELLEVVPDFDLRAPLLHCEQYQQPVVLALLSDAAAAVLEHLDDVFLRRAVR